MYSGNEVHYLVSNPVDVFFAGFRSDTLSLQRFGWQFAVEEDVMSRRMRIFMKNPNFAVYGVGYHEDTHFLRTRSVMGSHGPVRDMPLIRMNIGSDFHIISNTEPFELQNRISPVNMEPAYHTLNQYQVVLSKLPIFRPLPKEDTPRIILEKASIQEILQIALEKQDPRQKEIRQRIMKDEEMRKYGINSTLHTELHVM
jgi:hypothetical protein